MEDKQSNYHNNQHLIREAIRRIALGRSLERIDMAPGGLSGVGTARMIHGYVAKVHSDPADEEFETYGGTVDVGEYPDETSSSEPLIHKGVLPAAARNNDGGFLIIPTLFSEVTMLLDAASRHAYIVGYSHADIIRLWAHREVSIEVTQTEEIDPTNESSPDYDHLAATGNASSTVHTATGIRSVVRNDRDKETSWAISADEITQHIDKATVSHTAEKITQQVNKTAVTVADGKVTLGDKQATEPLVLGNELAQLMLDFLTECSQITTPTLMGTMPAINVPNFASLTSRIQQFLSKTSYTK